jgi:hypothetical protein
VKSNEDPPYGGFQCLSVRFVRGHSGREGASQQTSAEPGTGLVEGIESSGDELVLAHAAGGSAHPEHGEHSAKDLDVLHLER